MKHILLSACLALLSGPLFAPDLVLTRKVHSDAYSMMGNEVPAKDGTQTLWLGKDRMRMDDADHVTIVRLDLKKAWVLDPAQKTAAMIDLPFDMKKYIPAEMAPMMEQMMAGMKPVVTPTDETKKIGNWNVRKYGMTMGPPASMDTTLWVTKDIDIPVADFKSLMGVVVSMNPGGAAMAEEMRKIDGIPVYQERTQRMGVATMKSTEELVSAERKDPAEGWYDVPKDYTAKAYDPMADALHGPGAGKKPAGFPGGKPKPAGGG